MQRKPAGQTRTRNEKRPLTQRMRATPAPANTRPMAAIPNTANKQDPFSAYQGRRSPLTIASRMAKADKAPPPVTINNPMMMPATRFCIPGLKIAIGSPSWRVASSRVVGGRAGPSWGSEFIANLRGRTSVPPNLLLTDSELDYIRHQDGHLQISRLVTVYLDTRTLSRH